MKSIFWGLLFTVVTVSGETFFGPTSPSNRLAVGTNETIIFLSCSTPAVDSEGSSIFPDLIVGGVTFQREPTVYPCFIPGPAELITTLTNVMTFKRIAGGFIKSITVDTNSSILEVPAGKTIKFLRSFGGYGGADITVNRGTNSAVFSNRYAGLSFDAEIDGPVSLSIRTQIPNPPSNPSMVLIYCFNEDFLALPDLKIIQGGTGLVQISVQRSTDLANWIPVFVNPASSAEKSFYRLQISK